MPQATKRIRILAVLVLIFAALLVFKLYRVQIIQGHDFSVKAERQYVNNISTLFNRGSIFFTTKGGDRVSAATVQRGFTLAIVPDEIDDAQEAYQKLAEIIELDEENFLARAAKLTDPYEEVASRVTEDQKEMIEALDLSGVNLYRSSWRYYPGDRLASHSLGFIGYDGDSLAGRYGIERFYEDVLGREENEVYVNFFAEIFGNIKGGVLHERKHQGDIVTYIEPSVQAFLEESLSKMQEDWSADHVGGIVIDPKTGSIYALSALPGFDLNDFSGEETSVFQNTLVESVFEMGSIIKPLTVAMGLDTDTITSETTYNDKGYLILNEARISNFDGKGRGVVSMQEVLNQSLNTGVSTIVKWMGKDKFADYMFDLGVEEETGIDLPNEVAGLTSNLYSDRDIEYATASYGQGVALTPMATVRALSSLANGGKLVGPHIAREIDYVGVGSKKVVPNKSAKRVFKEETAEEITRMLVEVVDIALKGGAVKNPRYTIAAKTGTAQVANPNGGGYYENLFFHSFFGYFPAYEPRFLVFLYAYNPKGALYASATLTDPFMDVTDFLIHYYDIPPDR